MNFELGRSWLSLDSGFPVRRKRTRLWQGDREFVRLPRLGRTPKVRTLSENHGYRTGCGVGHLLGSSSGGSDSKYWNRGSRGATEGCGFPHSGLFRSETGMRGLRKILYLVCGGAEILVRRAWILFGHQLCSLCALQTATQGETWQVHSRLRDFIGRSQSVAT